MSGVLSFSEVASQSTVVINAVQSTKLSVSTCSQLNGRVPRLPHHQLHQVKTHYKSHTVHLFIRQKETSTITQRSLVFAIPNEGGKFERGGSHFCSDDPVFLASGDLDTPEKDPLVEIASSRSSEEVPSINSTCHGIQADILDKLKTIYLHLLASEQWKSVTLQKCDRTYLVSGTNLIHYLALKSLDIEQLQEELLSIGLLNLKSITPYILPGLIACIHTLESSSSNSQNGNTKQSAIKLKNRDLTIGNMRKQLSNNREQLFGPLQNGRTTRIMVTLGEEALQNQSLVPDILTSGATIVRINCAHGNPTIWSEIITRVRHSSQMLEKPCRILLSEDLSPTLNVEEKGDLHISLVDYPRGK